MVAKFNIDEEAIKKLAEILESTKLGEIEYEDNGRRVRVVSKYQDQPQGIAASVPVTPAVVVADTPPVSSAKHPGLVKSPMVGMVYVSSEPGAAAFVKVGDSITVGQTLLIIEAMKVMNPIKAPKTGKIKQIFIQDAQPVEYGEPLMIIE